MNLQQNETKRLLPENLCHCLRVSIEVPTVITDEQAIEKWHAQSPHRWIRVTCLYVNFIDF